MREKAKEKSKVNGEENMVLTKILKLGNPIIAGYLYSKIEEAEKAGIGVRYKVELDDESPISECKLVEALGTLFEHAVRSLSEEGLPIQKIFFSLKQKESIAIIKFAYTSKFLELDDMAAIWDKGSKRKGKRQDGSLYQLRKLAEDNDGNIYVCMKTVDDIDYLCMKVVLPYKK